MIRSMGKCREISKKRESGKSLTLIRIDQICSTCVGVLLVFYIYDVCYPDMELEIIPYQGNFLFAFT